MRNLGHSMILQNKRLWSFLKAWLLLPPASSHCLGRSFDGLAKAFRNQAISPHLWQVILLKRLKLLTKTKSAQQKLSRFPDRVSDEFIHDSSLIHRLDLYIYIIMFIVQHKT